MKRVTYGSHLLFFSPDVLHSPRLATMGVSNMRRALGALCSGWFKEEGLPAASISRRLDDEQRPNASAGCQRKG